MSDNPTRPIEFLLRAQTDDASYNHAFAKMDALAARVKEAKELATANYEASRLSVNELLAPDINEATDEVQQLGHETDKTADKFDKMGNRGSVSFKQLAKLATQLTLALSGTVVGSSVSFTQTYKGVDTQANAQIAAQDKLKIAFDDLGRVASRIVTPALEALARTIEIASMVLDKLFPAGQENPVSYFFNHTIPDAGKALIDLSGIVRTTAAAVKVSFEVGMDTLVTNLAIVVLQIGKGVDAIAAGLQSAVDDFSTTLTVVGLKMQDIFGRAFNAILLLAAKVASAAGNSDLASKLVGAQDQNAIFGDDGRSRYDQMIQQAQLDRSSRTYGNPAYFDNAITEQQQGLKGRTKTAEVAFHNTIDQIVKDVENGKSILDAFGKAITNLADKALDANRITAQDLEAFIQRNEQREKANAQFAADEKRIGDERTKGLLKAEKDKTDALGNLAKDQAKKSTEIVKKAGDARAKADIDFADNERKIVKQAQLKREQDLRQHMLRLDELAAAGDVAGFVQERNRFNLQSEQEDQTAAAEKQVRADEHAKRRAEMDSQEAADLQALRDAGAERKTEILTQYDEQTTAVKDAARDQLSELRKKHEDELIDIDKQFVKTLAKQGSHLADLDKVQAAYYADQTTKLQAFVRDNAGYLQQLYSMKPGAVYNGLTAGQIPTGGMSTLQQQAALAKQTVIFAQGAIQNTVGDLVTGSALGQALGTIAGSIGQALNLTPSAGATPRQPARHVGGAGA